MARHLLRAVFALASLLGLLGMAAGGTLGAGKSIVVLPTTGIVDDVMATYLREGIAQAVRDEATAVVVKLNTPGGNLSSTNDIVGTFLESPIPVIVWVAPAGGFAASAGTFVTLSANLAYMAPGTSIGAASPVGPQGEDIPGTLGQKVKNDAIAKITSIALARNRPVDWAVSTVRDAKSYPATDAVAAHAVDGLASSLDDVLAMANGRDVTVRGTKLTLHLSGATTSDLTMNPFQSFIRLLQDPNIAFLMFSGGSLALLYELMNPNFVTGILGALTIILAFIGLGSLPLNVGGLLLIALGILLFGLETTVTSHGLLGVGGIVCFFLGASALYTQPGDPFAPAVSAAWPLIIVMTLTFAAFMLLIVFTAIRTRRMTLQQGIVGSVVAPGMGAVVRRPLEPLGSIYAAGEEWSARSVGDQPIERGRPVKVVGMDGLTVLVEPAEQPSKA